MNFLEKLKAKYVESVTGSAGCRFSNRFAVLGDIHANLEALTAVLNDAKKQGVSSFICTGDVVGYGADPSECLKRVLDLNCPLVQGNHDSYAVTDGGLEGLNFNAMSAIVWTRNQLNDEEKERLRNLPMEVALGAWGGNEAADCQLVHSSLREPTAWHYIMKPERAEAALRAQEPDIVFFGHTHVPSIYSYNPETDEFFEKFPAKKGVHKLESGWKYLINPGSVGQPRDRNPCASYAVYDPLAGTIKIRRIKYDIATAQRKIKSAGLPVLNAERLSQGR